MKLLPKLNNSNIIPCGKKVLFYSSVADVKLLTITGFYATDINILLDLGCSVEVTNSFIKYLKFWSYDVSFIYFWSKGFIPAIFSKIFNKKVLFTGGIDRLDVNYNKSVFDYFVRKHVFRLCSMISDANIIVSNSDLLNIRLTKFKINRIKYLPHVIDFDKYKYNNQIKENIIITVAWMEDKENVTRKGVDKLLQVYSEFLKLNKDFKIIIIGSKGDGSKYLLELAEDLAISERVSFTGRISEEEKVKILHRSKYYFQLSLYEGFGIAAIEALAAGNIVFHSGRGGLSDGIGQFGVAVEDIENYQKIAASLHSVNCNYSNKQDFITAGISHVRDNFSYSVRRNGLLKIFQEMYNSEQRATII